jgi:ribonuclease Z
MLIYRHLVSSTVVDIPDFGCVLLDAGEGTLGQLQRRYGSKLWSDVLSRLKMIFISHMHADHHIGLRRILEERLQVGSQPVLNVLLIDVERGLE